MITDFFYDLHHHQRRVVHIREILKKQKQERGGKEFTNHYQLVVL